MYHTSTLHILITNIRMSFQLEALSMQEFIARQDRRNTSVPAYILSKAASLLKEYADIQTDKSKEQKILDVVDKLEEY